MKIKAEIGNFARAFVALCLIGSVVGCGGSGSGSGGHAGTGGHGGSGGSGNAATVQSIAVTPANPSVAVGGTQQFTATATLSDGTTKDLSASATWTSSDMATATISTSGLATGVAAGA